jgi:branched-chain amino acid transport system permease protein
MAPRVEHEHVRAARTDAAMLGVFAIVTIFTARHGSAFATTTAINFGLFTLLTASLQIMLGFSNQASLTQAGIYGIGAYVAVYVESKTGVPLPVALLASLAAGAVAGLVLALPLSRLREHILAMGTLAAQVILSEAFVYLSSLTGGVNGEAVPDAEINSVPVMMAICACAAGVIIALNHFRISRIGRQVLAVKADETMAASIGINVRKLRLFAVVISFAVAAGAGCLFTETAGFISPDDFTLTSSLAVLVAVILGGRSITWGTLAGAAAYSALNAETTSLPGLSDLLLGIMLVVVLGYLPAGLTGITVPGRLRHSGWLTSVLPRLTRTAATSETTRQEGGERRADSGDTVADAGRLRSVQELRRRSGAP